jgi:NDP-sugar pyrophosphorylase family protein
MHPHTKQTPKALLPVGGRQFADWQLRGLAAEGVTRVIYSIGHLGHQIRAALGDGSTWGLQIEYVDDGAVRLGTGGAVRKAIEVASLDEFFVLYGDSYLQVSFGDVAKTFQSSPLPALMTVMRNEGQWDTSNATFVDGVVTRYSKGSDQGSELRYIDYGLLAFRAEVIKKRISVGETADLADLCTELSDEGMLGGFEAKKRFYEVGSPQGLEDLERLLRNRPG